jgi:peptidoglycan/xylan/chitin deacetylase (PgdA/CDA1 family)
MNRKLIPAFILLTFILSACSVTPSQASNTTKVQPPAPETVESPPVLNPDPKVPPAGPGLHHPQGPFPVEAKPAIAWKPRGIGLPLAPSDPAAAEQKVAMLTFDDGPSNFTRSILETLKQENVKAVFFITGYGARNHPDLVERIHREGHILAVHTMTHPNMARLPKAEQRKEIQPLVELIEKVTGQRPKYFRPPFGAYNQDLRDLLAEMDLELINWTDGSLDWEGVTNGYKDPNKVVYDVMRQLHQGAVILMHDTMKHTAEALPEIIKQIRNAGYEFVTLP